MVHALRYVAAGTNHEVTNKRQEERLAITITNIFSSETGRTLRRRHRDHSELRDPMLRTSKGYLDKYRNLIALFTRQYINTALHLARVHAPFNPIREYFLENRAPV
jgi:hypothetical protein